MPHIVCDIPYGKSVMTFFELKISELEVRFPQLGRWL